MFIMQYYRTSIYVFYSTLELAIRTESDVHLVLLVSEEACMCELYF